MKKLFMTVLFLVLSASIWSQNHIPSVGENIMFFPLNKDNAASFIGYDCFYDAESVIDDLGKYNFKPKFRFNKNKEKLTPASEIENYTYQVMKQETLSKKEQKTFLLFLRRNEDGKNLILRIPWYTDKKSNTITQSFLTYKTENEWSLYLKKTWVYINLPYINVDTLSQLKNKFIGKEIVFNTRAKDDKGKTQKEHLEVFAKKLNSRTITFKDGQIDSCLQISFMSVTPQHIYQQLIVTAKRINGEIYHQPLKYYGAYYDEFYFLPFFYMTRDEYLNYMIKSKGCSGFREKFTGKRVYYGIMNKYNSANNYFIRELKTSKEYQLSDNIYTCTGFDIEKTPKGDFFQNMVWAYLKDDDGTDFRVQANPITPSSNDVKHFDCYFHLLHEADSISSEQLRLTLDYGRKYADIVMNFDKYRKTRFEKLARLYNPENALLIMRKKVKIGMNIDMCLESWGMPDDINSTEGSWGIHSQWVYDGGKYSKTRYLYFENGILTTIQD